MTWSVTRRLTGGGDAYLLATSAIFHWPVDTLGGNNQPRTARDRILQQFRVAQPPINER